MTDPTPPALAALAAGAPRTGSLRADTAAFLAGRGLAHVAGHCAQVAAEARRLAGRHGLDASAAEAAGLLHDISAAVPNEERVALAEALGLEVLPEERAAPMIIHQKLSAAIARHVFGVADEAVLSAVGCHTTLRAGATPLDMALFVADKIRWDQPGDPPYLADIVAAAGRSLREASRCYVDFLWNRRETLLVVHPWLAAAHAELAEG